MVPLVLIDVVGDAALPIVAPVQGLVATPGGATVIIGLTPALSISVAPSGIAPPAGSNPGPESGEAMPLEETFDDEDEQLADLLAAIPPPSNVELVLVPDMPLPDTPDDPPDIPAEVDAEVKQLAPPGLRPPGLSWVVPSGMPVPLD